ncbi:MAG: CocE/NonD family hydrolase, partial [Planctomycetes bacterium]|nr:CocE/NonD family hydrolase [Planctomycetota bacterium]
MNFKLLFSVMAVVAGVWSSESVAVDRPAANDAAGAAADGLWKRHRIHEAFQTVTAVAADFTGDGRADVISNSDGKTRLFVSPDWREVVLDENPQHNFIHSECFDVDADGDVDYIGARYDPGLIVWLECPQKPLEQPWKLRLVDDQVHGIHGVIAGDVDRDGLPDLLATSAQPQQPFPESLAWYRVPASPRTAQRWERFIFAKEDAPGLTHYLGFGDINGDGRPDAATGAKGGPQARPGTGDWFAWWEAPRDPRQPWTKHMIADDQPGATNIHPADVNGDGRVDFVASRGHGRGVIWFEAPDWKTHEIHPTLKEPHCLAVADMDGDGDVDAATCAYGDRIAAWFENDGRGNFTTHVVGRDQEAYDIRTVDLDGDEDLDLLIAGRGSRNVVWYENPLTAAKPADDAMGVIIERNVPVPMRDGVVLRADVHRPDRGGPHPVLVMRTPYSKQGRRFDRYVQAGYFVVCQDARGRFQSDGEWESFVRFETNDARDGYDTVEWAARLPGSTGRVGTFGASYNAFLQWRLAPLRPPSLVAMSAQSIPARYTDL